MGEEDDRDTRDDLDILFEEYDEVVSEARSAIQIIGLSVALLSVFDNLNGTDPTQSFLVKFSLILLAFALILAVSSYILSEYRKPRDHRVRLIGSSDRSLKEDLAESFTQQNLETGMNRAHRYNVASHLAYLLFASGIGCIILILFRMY